MNRFVISALAVCAASSLTFASESEEWLTLDKELENLSTSPLQGGSGLAVSGFLRSAYWNSSEPFDGSSINPGGDDVGGFTLDNARINLDGSVGNFDVHVAFEGNESGSGTGFTGTGFGFFRVPLDDYGVVVLDAYADWNFTDAWYLEVGRFRPPFLQDALRNENEMMFWQKTVVADFWSTRDQGVLVGGTFDMFGVWGAIQNGADGIVDEVAFTVRGEWNALGGGTQETEGAYGASQDMALNVGAAYYDDGTLSDLNAWAVDGAFSMGPFYASASIIGNGDDMPLFTPATTTFGGTPWDIDASFLFAGMWEVAGRYQNLDDDDDTSIFDIALNAYMEGHDAKFLVQYSSSTSDLNENEADMIILGMTVSV